MHQSDNLQLSPREHNTQTCDCEMCVWADRQERERVRTFKSVLDEWISLCSDRAHQADANALPTVTELALAGNRLILEANLLGQSEAFKTIQRQTEAANGLPRTN